VPNAAKGEPAEKPRLQTWTAIVEPMSGTGRRQELHTVATTEQDARKIFYRRKLRVRSIRALKDLKPVVAAGKVPASDLATFCKQMAIMTDTGMSMQEALEYILEETDNKALTKAIAYILEDIRGGSMDAWEAFTRHPGLFDSVFCALVKSGETTGALPAMFEVLSLRAERGSKFQNEIRQALMYPIGLLMTGFVVVVIIYWKVVPTFAHMYKELGAELPWMTQVTVSISGFVANHFLILSAILAGAGAWFFRWRKTPKGRAFFQRIAMVHRFTRDIIEKTSLAFASRALSTLIKGGATFHKAIELAAEAATLDMHKEALNNILEDLRSGQSDLPTAMEQHYAFRQLFKSCVKVGYRTGTLDVMLLKAAEVYESDVEAKLRQLSSMLEPMIIIVIGIIIGFIVLSLYLPVLNLVHVLGT
jgi:type IV pilus assembly protein PilC